MSNKPRKKSGSKQGQHKRRVDRQIIGLTMSWFDENPDTWGEIEYPQPSHRNPMLKPLAERIWQENLLYVENKGLFKWRISVEGVYQDGDAKRYCPVEIEQKCVLIDLSPHVKGLIDGVMERWNRKNWLGAEITIECLGN